MILILGAMAMKFEFLCQVSFKLIEQKTPEILHFHFLLSCSIASVTSYLNENEAENLQNSDVHLAQIPDFEMEYIENHLAH